MNEKKEPVELIPKFLPSFVLGILIGVVILFLRLLFLFLGG